MNIAGKIAVAIPLETLWTDKVLLTAKRVCYLKNADIVQLLRKSAVQFVVADVGHKLIWIDTSQCFGFWKQQAKQHIAEHADGINLEKFADNYAYVASLWTPQDETPIISLERYH